MGMFDWVRTKCPKEGCKGNLETQSKAGICLLVDYALETAPNEILKDIVGDFMRCDTCGTSKQIVSSAPVEPRYPVHLE